jgi:hypothetical protein
VKCCSILIDAGGGIQMRCGIRDEVKSAMRQWSDGKSCHGRVGQVWLHLEVVASGKTLLPAAGKSVHPSHYVHINISNRLDWYRHH